MSFANCFVRGNPVSAPHSLKVHASLTKAWVLDHLKHRGTHGLDENKPITLQLQLRACGYGMFVLRSGMKNNANRTSSVCITNLNGTSSVHYVYVVCIGCSKTEPRPRPGAVGESGFLARGPVERGLCAAPGLPPSSNFAESPYTYVCCSRI